METFSKADRSVSHLPGLRGGTLRRHSIDEQDGVEVENLDGLTPKESSRMDNTIEDAYVAAEQSRLENQAGTFLQDVLNISSVLADGAAAMVDDTFLKCFSSMTPEPWNWNFYLFPAWCLGVVFRFCVLFPLRLAFILGSMLTFIILFFTVQAVLKKNSPLKKRVEIALIQFISSMFVASWTGVIKFHGPRPVPAPNRVWVANHTSMIDYAILNSYSPFAVIMQLHPGWVGFLQTKCLFSLGCLGFSRTQAQDRQHVATKMKEHVSRGDVPLLIFPEGTCVNNEYCVMFKRGAFDLGATVCPIAIKYNKIFVDAFWNSKRQSFTQHLIRLMTSWALVCDVYFLEPQTKRPEETPDEFATRVQLLIAERAKLKVVPWDGYLKYYNLGDKHPQLIEKRRRVFADQLRRYL